MDWDPPYDASARLALGDFYVRRGLRRQAVEVYVEIARFFVASGAALKGMHLYKQVLKLDPAHAEASAQVAQLRRRFEAGP